MAKNTKEQKHYKLELKLLIRDSMDDISRNYLFADVSQFIRDLLKAGKYKEAAEWLCRNKHHMDPALKDMIASSIKEYV